MEIIERYRQKFDGMSEKEQIRFLAMIIAFATVIFAIALIITDFLTGGFDDPSVSFSDVAHYYKNISEITDKHLWPYSETPLEYPPFTLVVFLIPKLAVWVWPIYHIAYDLFAGFAFVVFAYLLYRIYQILGKELYPVLTYIVLITVICNQMVFDRNDIFAAAFITGALYLCLKDRVCLPAVLIACAAMIKIYPVVLVPIFMLFFVSKREWKNAFMFMIVSGLVCLLMELPFMIYDLGTSFSWVTYHSGRGLQVEGVVSSFVVMANFFVPCIDSIYLDDSQSITLHGEFPDAVASVMDKVMIIMMVLAIVLMAVRAYRRGSKGMKEDFRLLAMMSLLMVMTFITFSKVYSAQYSLWMLTLVPFIVSKGTESDDRFLKAVLIFCIPSFVSQCVAWTMGSTAIDNLVAVIIFIKNLAHLYLYYALIRLFLDYTKVSTEPVAQAE